MAVVEFKGPRTPKAAQRVKTAASVDRFMVVFSLGLAVCIGGPVAGFRQQHSKRHFHNLPFFDSQAHALERAHHSRLLHCHIPHETTIARRRCGGCELPKVKALQRAERSKPVEHRPRGSAPQGWRWAIPNCHNKKA